MTRVTTSSCRKLMLYLSRRIRNNRRVFFQLPNINLNAKCDHISIESIEDIHKETIQDQIFFFINYQFIV